MTPGSDHAAIQLASTTDSGSDSRGKKLALKEVATLAWMWNKHFFSDSSKPQVFSLICGSLSSAASASQTTSDLDSLVEKVLSAASQGKWKPGLVLTKKLRECMPVKESGWLPAAEISAVNAAVISHASSFPAECLMSLRT